MKSRAEQQAIVDSLKTNREAWLFLPVEYREFVERNWNKAIVLCGDKWIDKANGGFIMDSIYRLSHDFQLPPEEPKERFWFFNPISKTIMSADRSPRCEYIKITAEQKAYLETKPKEEAGFEWVLKEAIDSTLYKARSIVAALVSDGYPSTNELNGIRWVKVPKVEPRFVEYLITIEDGKYYCKVDHQPISNTYDLHQLQSIVGFAGVRFEWENGIKSAWLDCITVISEKDKSGFGGIPATPIAARFYLKGESQ